MYNHNKINMSLEKKRKPAKYTFRVKMEQDLQDASDARRC